MAERLVVIGGDAAGMSAASNARRRNDDLEIVALERGTRTSYAACGIPYHVAGEIEDLDSLVARTPQEFRDRQRIDVRTRHEVTAIDTAAGSVEVRDLERERTYSLGYDHLLIGTGARPIRPPFPGIDLPFIRGVQTLDDAAGLVELADADDVDKVVVVGGGYIGLEMAEAFVRWGAECTVVDAAPNVMRTMDPDMAELIEKAMDRHGVDLITGVGVAGFEPGKVLLDSGELDADLVVLGIGVTPNGELAAEAGIATGDRGAISVDRLQRTSADGVWAAGDCAESFHRVLNRPVHVALGTVANRQGRVAGINIGGGYASFPGVVGTAITRLCSTEIARTGLSEHEATEAGFDYVIGKVTTKTRAHYFPGADTVTVKVLAERISGRVIGCQIVGGDGAAKRIDTMAAAITAQFTVHDMVNLDLSYAPPFSPVWDPVVLASRQALDQV